jgi:Ca-activated chloride channel family protein
MKVIQTVNGGLVLAALLSAAPSRAQNLPRFEAGIEVVNVPVSVTDVGDRPVANLRGVDFAIFEDGVRQEVSVFDHGELPIALVLMIDTSASMNEKLPLVQKAALRLTRALSARDQVEVVQFNERAEVLQDFTSDPSVIESAVRRTHATGATGLHNALYATLKALRRQSPIEQQRRAIVLLSDGLDTTSLVTEEDVLALARKSDISIYTIGPRSQLRFEADGAANSRAIHLLTTLAHDSGAQSYFPESFAQLDPVYDRIAQELRTQYQLGYLPTNATRDGKWRKIVVQTPTLTSVQLRHKLGYFAPMASAILNRLGISIFRDPRQ